VQDVDERADGLGLRVHAGHPRPGDVTQATSAGGPGQLLTSLVVSRAQAIVPKTAM
jgi:hypothetical protein